MKPGRVLLWVLSTHKHSGEPSTELTIPERIFWISVESFAQLLLSRIRYSEHSDGFQLNVSHITSDIKKKTGFPVNSVLVDLVRIP
jgi:hypothetical protein